MQKEKTTWSDCYKTVKNLHESTWACELEPDIFTIYRPMLLPHFYHVYTNTPPPSSSSVYNFGPEYFPVLTAAVSWLIKNIKKKYKMNKIF